MSGNNGQPVWVVALLSLTGEMYRTWTYLYWRQGNKPDTWPSQERIAADLGLSVRYVRQITAALERDGWLKVTWAGPGRGAREHAKRYVVTCPKKRNHSSPFEGEESGTTVPLLPEKSGATVPPKCGTTVPVKSGTTVPPNTIQRTLSGEHNQQLAAPPEEDLDLSWLRPVVATRCERLHSTLTRHFPDRSDRSKTTHRHIIDYFARRALSGIRQDLAHLTDAVEWVREAKRPGVRNPEAVFTKLCQQRGGYPKSQGKARCRQGSSMGAIVVDVLGRTLERATP